MTMIWKKKRLILLIVTARIISDIIFIEILLYMYITIRNVYNAHNMFKYYLTNINELSF